MHLSAELHLPTAAQSDRRQRRLWRSSACPCWLTLQQLTLPLMIPSVKSRAPEEPLLFLCTDVGVSCDGRSSPTSRIMADGRPAPTSRAKVRWKSAIRRMADMRKSKYSEEQIIGFLAGRGRDSGGGGLPQGRLQRRDVLQRRSKFGGMEASDDAKRLREPRRRTPSSRSCWPRRTWTCTRSRAFW